MVFIEKAYELLYGKKVRVIVSLEDFGKMALEIKHNDKLLQPTVIKPHGTINMDEKDPRSRYKYVRMSLDQVGQGLSNECKKVIDHLVARTPMIFLGYSGCDHFSLQPALCNTTTNKTAIWLYHCERDTESKIITNGS